MFVFLFIFSTHLKALELNKKLPVAELSGENGGRLDESPWKSDEVVGKVTAIFYVDPDLKDLNAKFSEALQAKKYSKEKFQSIAIINMKATWAPNFAIRSSLRKKQKQFPHTLYLRDRKRHLISAWGIPDEQYNVILTDAMGTVIYKFYGEMKEDEIAQAIALLDERILSGGSEPSKKAESK